MFWGYKNGVSFEKRLEHANRILAKYPDRIPIILEKRNSFMANQALVLDYKKYLVPDHITVGQFYYIVRKRAHLRAEDALFFFVSDQIPVTSASIRDIYEKFKSKDKFLYVTYSEERKFG